MAQIYVSPTKEQILNNISQDHKDTILKMIEIQDILLVNPPNDKKFNKKSINYMLDYIAIINSVEKDKNGYKEEYIKNAINNLYNKIFKHRRY